MVLRGVAVQVNRIAKKRPRDVQPTLVFEELAQEVKRVRLVGICAQRIRVDRRGRIQPAGGVQRDPFLEPREMRAPRAIALAGIAGDDGVVTALLALAALAVAPRARSRRARLREVEVGTLAHRRDGRMRQQAQPEFPVLAGVERLVEAMTGIAQAAMKDARHARGAAVVVHDERVEVVLPVVHDAMEAIDRP